MNIHEYQAKALFKKYGVATTNGVVVTSAQEAKQKAQELNEHGAWVVKAQIHAGGRGKAGGVKLVSSLDDVEKVAKSLLGKALVTHQTSKTGKIVHSLYIEEATSIDKEYYLGMVLDRNKEMPVMMASLEGGMDIEEVAKNTPQKIIKVAIDPSIGFRGFHARELVFGLGLEKEEQKEFIQFATALYKMYIDLDIEMIEINPLVKNTDGRLLALDGKIGFDDNALSRHKDIEALRDETEEDETEREADKHNLHYIKLDGNVGCMVNGAGLAMGTMDTINFVGGKPANFLDVGGTATAATVAKGFELILRDKNVKSIFVNIFGGIVRCDRIANGIIEATKITDVHVPIIVRLDGTNSKEAKEILKNSNIKNIISVDDLEEGAIVAVKEAKGII